MSSAFPKNVGELEIVSSGSVIAFKDKNLKFLVSDEEGSVWIEIIFNDDEKEEKQSIKYRKVDNKTLTIELIKFDNPLGTGTKRPIKIGTISGKEFYLSFSVYPIDEIKNFIYTFYSGAVRDG